MRKFKGKVGVGGQSYRQFEFEVEDAAIEDDIEEIAWDTCYNLIDCTYHEVIDESKPKDNSTKTKE
jgi:hypothetical protein